MTERTNEEDTQDGNDAVAPVGDGAAFAPPYPTLAALGVLSLWICILSIPMLAGNFLAAPGVNDQYFAGYAFRQWGADQWGALGHVPLWNPNLYGGLPFVGAMHGDIFYPTAWLRLGLPTHVAMNLGFFAHYIMAGAFAYWFLRQLKVSWTGAVVGGLGYQLSGVIGSYVNPGHDGKLFVTALLPLGLVMLTYAIRQRRYEAYAGFALVVGLALLSPQTQMTQYFLITTGIYALYLVFGDGSSRTVGQRVTALGLATAAVAVGFGVAMVQYLPFLAYIPFSPRSEGALRGFDWSVTYAIPWQHVPELFFSQFVGSVETYWSTNGLKLHSEYLGLPLVVLAGFGALDKQRRPLVYWIGGIGVLFLLVALGGSTPFYRVWWSVVPFVKQTRAPGMALYVVALMVSSLAAFGADRVLRGDGPKHAMVWVAVGAGVALLGLGGAFGTMAESLAQGNEVALGRPFTARAAAAQDSIRMGALASGLALAALGGLTWAFMQRRVTVAVFSLLIVGIVGTDMWMNARGFWNYSRAQDELYARDEIIDRLTGQTPPYRVDDRVYGEAAIMAHGVPQLLGYHGNELHAFNELLRSSGTSPFRMWELYSVNQVILPAGAVDSLPEFEEVLSNVQTGAGKTASLYERIEPLPYARLVPGAAKVPSDQAIATAADPRFPLDRVVLLDPDAPVNPDPLDSLPSPLSVEARVVEWSPGDMRIEFSEPAASPAYLVISENYYKDWRASIDGADGSVLRGDNSLITIPVPAGAREVHLEFVSDEYRKGKLLSGVSLIALLVAAMVPVVARRRGG